MEENPDIQIVFPKEGAYIFFDNWCITKGAKHYDAAMEFINYMLRSETAQAVSKEFPYLNPNTAAVKAMGSTYTGNPAKNPPESVISSGEYVKNLSADVLTKYSDMWTKLKQ
jgi:spermidine/putrescine-binding protein